MLVASVVVLTVGLVVVSLAWVRVERANKARPAVCELVGELYRAALDGPVEPETVDQWTAKIDLRAARLSRLADPFGVSAKASQLAESAHQGHLTTIRSLTRGADCPGSTFPPVRSAVFDELPVAWAALDAGPPGVPLVVHLAGAQLPSDSAVAENVRSASLETLADAGVPIDRLR